MNPRHQCALERNGMENTTPAQIPFAVLADKPAEHDTVIAAGRTQQPCAAPARPAGRQRLWEIAPVHHCVLLGAAFDARELRHMFQRARYGVWEAASDYQLHSSAVSLAASANRFSRSVQRKLDERYEAVIAVFRGVSSTLELMATWESWVERGECVAAYWAAVTHPLCDPAASETLSQEMHMAAHTAFIANRAANRRIRSLQDANGVLEAQLARLREQCRALRAEASQLRVAMQSMRTELHACQATAAAAREELERWRSGDEIQQWQHRCKTLAEAHAAAMARIAAERRTVAKLAARVEWLQQRTLRAAAEDAPPDGMSAPAAAAQPAAANDTERVPDLDQACVLCVGGRASLVPKYRTLIGQARADFLYHDGGLEDHLGRLPAMLSSAHAVICFSGEVSHAAYRTVKRYCKLRGKPCALIEQPSISGMLRALGSIRDLLLARKDTDMPAVEIAGRPA
jgi:hypothetical protein